MYGGARIGLHVLTKESPHQGLNVSDVIRVHVLIGYCTVQGVYRSPDKNSGLTYIFILIILFQDLNKSPC